MNKNKKDYQVIEKHKCLNYPYYLLHDILHIYYYFIIANQLNLFPI